MSSATPTFETARKVPFSFRFSPPRVTSQRKLVGLAPWLLRLKAPFSWAPIVQSAFAGAPPALASTRTVSVPESPFFRVSDSFALPKESLAHLFGVFHPSSSSRNFLISKSTVAAKSLSAACFRRWATRGWMNGAKTLRIPESLTPTLTRLTWGM